MSYIKNFTILKNDSLFIPHKFCFINSIITFCNQIKNKYFLYKIKKSFFNLFHLKQTFEPDLLLRQIIYRFEIKPINLTLKSFVQFSKTSKSENFFNFYKIIPIANFFEEKTSTAKFLSPIFNYSYLSLKHNFYSKLYNKMLKESLNVYNKYYNKYNIYNYNYETDSKVKQILKLDKDKLNAQKVFNQIFEIKKIDIKPFNLISEPLYLKNKEKDKNRNIVIKFPGSVLKTAELLKSIQNYTKQTEEKFFKIKLLGSISESYIQFLKTPKKSGSLIFHKEGKSETRFVFLTRNIQLEEIKNIIKYLIKKEYSKEKVISIATDKDKNVFKPRDLQKVADQVYKLILKRWQKDLEKRGIFYA